MGDERTGPCRRRLIWLVLVILLGTCGVAAMGSTPSAALETCRSCGAELAADALYCHVCGAPVAADSVFCWRCGLHLPLDARYCPRCGSRLCSAAEEEMAAPPASALRRTLPPEPEGPDVTPPDPGAMRGMVAGAEAIHRGRQRPSRRASSTRQSVPSFPQVCCILAAAGSSASATMRGPTAGRYPSVSVGWGRR